MPIQVVRQSDGKIFAARFSKAEIPVGRESSYVLPPEEYRANDGSDYWRVTPFDRTPWLNAAPPVKREFPVGFETIMGPPPAFDPGEETNEEWRHERAEFETKLRTYVRAGWPITLERPVNMLTGEAYFEEELQEVEVVYAQFGLGAPYYFLQQDAQHGERWMARFPEMDAAYKPAFGINARDAWASETVEQADVVIAQSQAKIRAAGIELRHDMISILLPVREEEE